MKRRSLFVLLALAALLTGCEPETYLFVDESPLTFSEEGGSATIDLVANKDWSASSNNGWCTVTPSSGAGDAGGTRLTVKCNKNDGYDDRSSTITIRCAELTKNVQVSQSKKRTLALSQTEFNVGDKGGTISVNVQSSISYTCTIVEGSSWITAISAKGLSTETRQFTVKENTTYDVRVGRIRFADSASGLSEDVIVRQSQNGAIIISQKDYNVSSAGGTITVEVKSNVNFNYQIEEGSNWITAVGTKGLTTQKRQFTIKENTSYDDRDGKIRFYDSATGMSEYVTVHQSRKGAIIISKKEYNVASEGGTIKVQIQSNVNYKYQIVSGSAWISAVNTKGLTNSTVEFTIKENTSYDDREGKIRFTDSSTGASEEVVVRQSRAGAIIISQKEYNVASEGGIITVEIQSNVNYKYQVVSGGTWISAVNTKGLTASTVDFSVKANTAYDDREGKIRFSDSSTGLSEDVIVRQSKTGAIIISKKEYSVGAEGGSFTVEVKSNLDFKYQIVEGSAWITSVKTKGLSTHTLEFSVKENTSYEDRQGKIRFSDAATGLSEDVVVLQSRTGTIVITQKEYNVDADGGTITVEIKTNVDFSYQITSGSTWISAVKTKGVSTKTMQFTIKANTSYDDREGQIRFYDSNSGSSETIVVKQAAKEVVKIEKTQYELSYAAQLLEISLLENTEYEVKIATDSQGWINKLDTKGLNTSSFSLIIDENENKAREGVVYVTFASDIITLKIKQADGTITIPDANFRQYCVKNFDKNGDGVLSHKEARNVTNISVSTENIESLQGIEYFINLQTLYCYGNWDSSQKVYTGKLTSLDVSKNTNLINLYCYSNQLTSLKISGCSVLKTLYCYNNKLEKLEVREFSALESLSCANNPLTSLNLSGLRNLKGLYCNNCQLTSLDVSGLSALTELSCFSYAYDYYFYTQRIANLNVSNNPALSYLSCGGIQITSLDVSNNTELEYLYCGWNYQMTNLDVSKNTKLKSLQCCDNKINSLDLSNNRELTYLDCSYNEITSLKVANSTALQTLYCYSNQLMSLDVSRNTALTDLRCYSNQLTSLDISNNNALSSCDCRWNNSNIIIYIKGGQLFSTFLHDDSAVIQEKGAIPSGNVSFKDSNFKSYCVKNFDKNGDGEVSYAEAFSVTRISVTTDEIASLQGIEHFVNLQELYCCGSGWNSGQRKYIYGKLASLDLSKNVALKNLNCYYNQLTSLNVANNTALQSLDCWNNKLTSLDVSRNTALTYLSCGNNQLTSLDVSKNTQLTDLYCYSNQLTSLDVSRHTSLQRLSCYSNQLTSLDVSRNTSLQTLYCYSNQLTSLDVSRNTSLTDLRCSSNQLTSLDVSKNTKLTYLSCSSNQLTSLNVTKNTALNYLYCSENQLTSIDVTKNTALTYLSCGINQLTSLDVSKNSLLESLYCYNTTMTDLYLAPGQSFKNYDWYSGTKVRYK